MCSKVRFAVLRRSDRIAGRRESQRSRAAVDAYRILTKASIVGATEQLNRSFDSRVGNKKLPREEAAFQRRCYGKEPEIPKAHRQ